MWLAFIPLILFVLVALTGIAVRMLVEQDERQRSLRRSVPPRQVFRPVLIKGGKPPAEVEQLSESKTA